MADNVTQSVKDLDQYLKNADESLRNLISDFSSLQEKASKKNRDLFGTEVKRTSKSIQSVQSKIKDLSDTIKNLMNNGNNSPLLQRMIKDLDKSFNALTSTYTRINKNHKVFQSDTSNMTKAQESLNNAILRYQNLLKNTAGHTQKLNTRMTSLVPTIQSLGRAFGVYFSARGLVQFAKKLADVRGEFELQQRALQAILQNKQKADEIWDRTMQAALQSPFTAMQLTKYTKQLAAYRIETEKLFDTTKRLADVSAGLGVDMQRLILAYGQVKAANYLRASEIRQFTEAGVNILGELAQYFTDTREGMYTTAQVMDMVQKRLVTFKDVEAIFKRLTDEGGIFYNMQYIQSQTLKGQINKLKDAYDQMLNNMGKANEGTLRDFVALLNDIVRNWRYWVAAIKSIGFGALIGWLTKLATTLKGVSVAGIQAGRGVSKFVGALQYLKGNWLTLAIGVLPAVGAEFYNLNKRMKDVNHDIDEQNLKLYDTQQLLLGYQEKIEKNNAVLKNSAGNEEKLKDKREENLSILSKLKSDYPELAAGMEIQKNGVIDLTDALKKENEELEKQITLNSLMKQNSIFNENFIDDASQLSQSYIKQQTNIINAIAQARSLLVQMKQSGLSDTREYDIIYKISQINPSNIQEATRRIIELKNNLNFARIGNTGKPSDFAYRPLGEYWNLYLKAVTGTQFTVEGKEEELTKEFGNLENTIAFYLEKGIRDVDEYNKEIEEKFGGNFFRWYALNVNRVQKDIDSGVHDAYRYLRESLIKNGNANMPGMQDFYRNWMKSNLVDPYFRAWEQSVDELEKAGWRIPFATGAGTPDPFATKPSNTKSESEILAEQKEKQGKVDAAWRRRISLLEEMKKRYDELSKSAYGYAKSNTVVRNEFQKAWNSIFGGILQMSDIQFMSAEGMESAFELLLSKAGAASDAVKEELQKKSDSYGARKPIVIAERIREDFGRQLEDAFNNYELTLELSKLNLPKGLAEELWGIDETSLVTLREKLTSMYNGLRDENGQLSGDALKDYENFLNKIDDLERKQQRERLKDYAKYLEYQYSERVKLEMDYVRKMAQLEAETAIPEEQKRAIREGIDREYAEAAKKQDWEDFKGSEFYVQMMEDLERHSTSSLEIMREKLLEMRENAENLSPRALKEVVNALEKIDKMTAERKDPFVRWKEAMDAMKDTDIKKVYEALTEQRKQQSVYEEQQRQLEEMIALEQERNRLELEGYNIEEARIQLHKAEGILKQSQLFYDTFSSDGSNEQEQMKATLLQALNNAKADVERWSEIIRILSGQSIVDKQKEGNVFAGLSISEMQKLRIELKKNIKELENNIDRNEELTRKQKELNDATQAMLESLKDWAQSFASVFDGVMDSVDYFTDQTYGMTAAWKEFGDTSVSAFNDLVNGIEAFNKAKADYDKMEAGSAAAKALMSGSILKLALVVLGVLIKVINAIAKKHDSQLDKQIEVQQEKIDALTRAYERLEKQIEKTLSTASYMRIYNEQVSNLHQQIKALEAQRAAEEAKKNTDTSAVQGYTDSIQDIYDKLDELQQKQLEVFGGIGKDNYRSWAEGFVSAWKDAFLETGDGLDALQDHFDEFLQEWFVKQATMRIAAKALKPIMTQIDKAVSGSGAVDMNRLYQIKDEMLAALEQLNIDLTDFAGWFGLGDSGSLSGLAAGIQGMTEEQANILEAYWNSVRGYNASIDANVARIATILGAGGVETNPMLQHLSNIADNTAYIVDIYNMLNSTRRNLGQGQGFVTYQL